MILMVRRSQSVRSVGARVTTHSLVGVDQQDMGVESRSFGGPEMLVATGRRTASGKVASFEGPSAVPTGIGKSSSRPSISARLRPLSHGPTPSPSAVSRFFQMLTC